MKKKSCIKYLGLKKRIEKRMKVLREKDDRESIEQWAKLALILFKFDDFKLFEKMVLIKSDERLFTTEEYHNYLIEEYKQGYKKCEELFETEKDYLKYALNTHFKDEDLEFIILTNELKAI